MTGHVALIHNGRCGSTVLLDLLAQTPELVGRPEPFLGYFGAYLERMREQGKFVDYPWLCSPHYPGDPIAYLRELLPPPPYRLLSSIKLYHLRGIGLSFEAFLAAMGELGYTHFIFLRRDNYLRKVMSSLVAEAKVIRGSREAYFNPGEGPAEKLRVHLDVDDVEIDSSNRPLLEHFARWDAEYAAMDEQLRRVDHLEFEFARDLRANPIDACKRAQRYLGVEELPVKLRLSPTTPFRPDEILINYDEVAAHLGDSPWAWMATPGSAPPQPI